VFVSVGTDHHPFERLIAWIDDWQAGAAVSGVSSFVQYGTSSRPRVAEGSDYVSHQELEDRISAASAFVCHGGPGTIVDCLRSGIKPIVVPRRKELGEHVDDHQVRFAERLHASGFIHLAETEQDLARLLERALAGAPEFAAAETQDVVRSSVKRFSRSVSDLLSIPEEPFRVLYIGGWGRSGSTLLDRLLGQLPGFFSVGEMRDVWLRGVIENRRCGCGESFHDCPFWSEVGEVAFGGWDRGHAERLRRLRLRYDRPWMPPLLALRRVHTPGLGRYVEATGRLYRAIREVSKSEVIVDSTKIPSYALLLGRVPGVDLRFVHLVRDSRGVIHSWNKSIERTDATGRPDRMIRYGSASASGRYLLYNWTAGSMRRSTMPYLFERYEDLVADPVGRLSRIVRFAGEEPEQFDFIEGRTAILRPNHSIDGNPMRFSTGALTIRPDDAWRDHMDRVDRKVVTTITGPLLHRYGYR
jgi:UDP-N-acetylglucosamine transferase subunit ALG13